MLIQQGKVPYVVGYKTNRLYDQKKKREKKFMTSDTDHDSILPSFTTFACLSHKRFFFTFSTFISCRCGFGTKVKGSNPKKCTYKGNLSQQINEKEFLMSPQPFFSSVQKEIYWTSATTT